MHTLPSRPEPTPQSTGSPARGRAIANAIVLALLLTGLWLRTHQLGQKSLWLDEAYSAWISEQPLPDLFSWTVQTDQHPPLYYLILRAWTKLGGSHNSPDARAFWIRLPSAFFGTLTVAVIYTLGHRFAGQKTRSTASVLATLVLALSPFHVWFGQEARMYALLTLNASLAMLGLVRLLTTPPTRPSPAKGTGEGAKARTLFFPPGPAGGIEGGKAWMLYILFTAATLWTHNTAILFWAAANLYVLGFLAFSRWWRVAGQETGSFPRNPVSLSLKQWLPAQLAILVLWSPWLGPFIRQTAGVDREFWIPAPTWGTLAGTLNAFLSAHLPQDLAWQSLTWLAAGMLLAAGTWMLRKKRALLALLAILFVTPIAGELLISLRRPIFYTRTLIWATLPLYLLLAIGATRALPTRPGLRTRRRAIAKIVVLFSLGTLVAANIQSLQNYYTNYQKEAWDQAAKHVSQHAQPGDLILFNASWVQLAFDFYFDSPVAVVRHGIPIDLFEVGTLEPKMTEQDLPYLEALVQEHNQIWLIYSHNWYTDPQSLIPKALAQHRRLADRRHFYGIEVHRYAMSEP